MSRRSDSLSCCVLRAACISALVASIIIRSSVAVDAASSVLQPKKINVDQTGAPGNTVYDRQINEVTGIGYPGYQGYQMYLPQVLLGIFMPVAILIGIGLIIIKLFIIALWAYSRSGGYGIGPWGGYGYGGYGGYPAQYAASTNAWRYDPSVGRSLGHDRDDQPLSPFIGATVMSLVDKVSTALAAFEKKHGSSVRAAFASATTTNSTNTTKRA